MDREPPPRLKRLKPALRDPRRPGGRWQRPLPEALHAELRAARRRRRATPAWRLIEDAGLPGPLWNPRLYLDGAWLLDPAAYWPRHGVLLVTGGSALTERHPADRLGLRMVRATPARLRQDAQPALRDLGRALATGPHGPWTRITVGPASPVPG